VSPVIGKVPRTPGRWHSQQAVRLCVGVRRTGAVCDRQLPPPSHSP
jgi:hypothetical protein